MLLLNAHSFFPLHPTLIICRCIEVYWFRQRKSVIQSDLLLTLSVVDGGGLRRSLHSRCGSQIAEVVIAHKPLSVLITPKDPKGWSVHVSEVLTLCSSVLIATLEAPFIQRCALCYFHPLYMWAQKPSRSTKLENLRVASNKSTVPQAFPPSYYRAPTDQPTQYIFNK